MAKHRENDPGIHLNLNIRGLTKSATLTINEQSLALQKSGRKIYKLGFGQSPFPVPAPVVERLKKNAHQKDYLAVKGLYELRAAIAGYWERKQGLKRHAENILIGPGSKELLFILQLVYYGDLVIPTPSWVSYSPQALIIGRRVKWVKTHPENDWRLSAEDLEAVCREDPGRPRIVVLNYPANPTGATYTTERLRDLAKVARKYKVILVSDEIYGELHHTGQHVSIARFYPEGTIISSGISKWCGAGGWRLGFFTFPPDLDWLLDAMSVVASETFTATSAPIQYAAVSAFEENPLIEAYLKNAQKILRIIGRTLHARLADFEVTAPKPRGGFYLFPDFSAHKESFSKRGITTSSQLCKALLEETGVALLPSYDFGRPSDELTARLSYVDFDGGMALQTAGTYPGKALDISFVEKCAPEILKAVDRIREFVIKE